MASLRYSQAICEGFKYLLDNYSDVTILGQGLWSPWYVGESMTDLDKLYGRDRILDTPICENTTTGVAIGAAMSGLRTIVVHPRMDFMLLAMDTIINQAANWSYMFGGQVPVPVVIRSIINRRGEQGAQHSQALQALFAHIPGLKVVMPTSPSDAKNLMIASTLDPNPILYIDDRDLYHVEEEVGDEYIPVEIGTARVVCEGSELTIVAISSMVELAREAMTQADMPSIELIDLRTVKPWDAATIGASVQKTGRLVVLDSGWFTGSVATDISAHIANRYRSELQGPVLRVALPDCPAPCARTLEDAYYPTADTVRVAVQCAMRGEIDEKHCASVPGRIGF